MDLGAILNSDNRLNTRMRSHWADTSSCPKPPACITARPRTTGRESLPPRPDKSHPTHDTAWMPTTAGDRSSVVSHYSASRQRGLHTRAESAHVDSAALQSLSLGSDRMTSPMARPSSIHTDDQRSKYHRSIYGTSGLHVQSRGTPSIQTTSIVTTPSPFYQTPTPWRTTQLPTSQTYRTGPQRSATGE